MEVIETPEDMQVVQINPVQAAVSAPYFLFDHVTFSYNKIEPNLFDLSFSLEKGETLGIIGATGSGKSTLAQLFLRFYDPDQGNIYLEGKDIRTIPFEILRKKFGVVFQNDTIFEDSILENIRLGRKISFEEVQNAVEYARAKEFIEEEGRGYENTVSVRGANLSGGQKQRILIARALAARPDILILDDSSSALDYKTDAFLRKELKEHFPDTTTILIAQRISSVMQSDHILVLDEGKMIGYGTHQELMENCEIYREIGKTQMGEC